MKIKVIAAIFAALFLASCGTAPKYAQGCSGKATPGKNWGSCAAYQ